MKKWWLLIASSVVFAGPVLAVDRPRPTIRAIREEAREEFKEKRLQLREARGQSVEEFRQRLGQIRDERKRKLVSLLAERICAVNRTRTAVMMRHLERMGRILDRLVATRGESEEAVAARKAIEEAKAAVSAQAGADCAVELTAGEGTVRRDVIAARKRLQNSLKSAHDMVKTAREAVRKAIDVSR